ncbi:MAG: hypothetical protein ACKOB6_01335 [Candidatus Kapaibacterium sp.]
MNNADSEVVVENGQKKVKKRPKRRKECAFIGEIHQGFDGRTGVRAVREKRKFFHCSFNLRLYFGCRNEQGEGKTSRGSEVWHGTPDHRPRAAFGE